MKFFFVLLSLALCGCTKEAQKGSLTTNPNFQVDLLFEHEGCKVYRFEDGGNSHYYVRCANSARTSDTKLDGEGSSHPDEIPTVQGR